MRVDPNGIPYYMNHQVWKQGYDDSRGLGGDQLQMAMSSWKLLYAYSGIESVKQNMKFMADYYLSHSLSPSNCVWSQPAFPIQYLNLFNCIYDGDMVIGPGFLQPDKSGSLGLELVPVEMSSKDFYLQSTSGRYLDAAISTRLAGHC